MRVYSERPSESLDKRQAFFDLVQRSRVELPTTESKIKFLKPICLVSSLLGLDAALIMLQKEELPQRSKDLRLGSGKPDPQQDKNLKISTSKNEDAKNDDTRDSDLKADDMKGGDSKSDATKDNELKPGNLGDSNLEGSTPEDSSRKNDHQRVDHTESRATSTAAAGRTARQRKTKESLETSKEKSSKQLQRIHEQSSLQCSDIFYLVHRSAAETSALCKSVHHSAIPTNFVRRLTSHSGTAICQTWQSQKKSTLSSRRSILEVFCMAQDLWIDSTTMLYQMTK